MNPTEAFKEMNKADNVWRHNKKWTILSVKEPYEINSVRRETADGEVFTVGDVIDNGKFRKKIKSLLVYNQEEIVFKDEDDIDGIYSLEGYKKVNNLKETNNGWTVVAYRSYGADIRKNGFGKWVDNHLTQYNAESLEKNNCISEVYRHKDSQFFRIGDVIHTNLSFHAGEIKSFVRENDKLVAVTSHWGAYLDKIIKYEKTSLKGIDSYFNINGKIPCAFYSVDTDSWWNFNPTIQKYELENEELLVYQESLKAFETENNLYLPFYNEQQLNRYKKHLEC